MEVTLRWHRFSAMTAARSAFRSEPCVYVQADRDGRAIRVGLASAGLGRRYYGGNAYAMDAAMHGSGNFVFVAPVERGVLAAVEARLIYAHRESLPYNNLGKLRDPSASLTLTNAGDPPTFA